ncbi:RDD family protein [Pararhodonellum marinum]|uniref:RDD family protein n=1 Tax=Pararhodonellum marinum TaxID=2755358 RepID=UPI00188F429A|nr:RDD family protein [Pararhodonellum marinum]
MDNFQIETAQNISINQRVAGLGERLLAYLIDILIIIAYWLVVIYLMVKLKLDDPGKYWSFYMVLGLPALMYSLLFETFMDGKSPGKSAMKLRVVKLDGSKPTLGSYFIRWILRIVDISLSSGGIAVLTILLNGKGQRLGDLAAGTAVISEKPHASLSDTLLEELPIDYQPLYPQVMALNDVQIQTIKSVYREALSQEDFRVIQKLAEKVAEMANIQHEQKSMAFLEQVIKDYNFYTQK